MKNGKSYERKIFNKPIKGGDFAGYSKVDSEAHEPVQAEPLEVKVFGNFDKAMRTFRALVQKERILSLYKEKQSFEKPSDKKRRKRNEMKRKLLELDMRDESPRFKKKEREDVIE